MPQQQKPKASPPVTRKSADSAFNVIKKKSEASVGAMNTRAKQKMDAGRPSKPKGY